MDPWHRIECKNRTKKVNENQISHIAQKSAEKPGSGGCDEPPSICRNPAEWHFPGASAALKN